MNWRLPEWFPDLTADQLQQLKNHHAELIKFNGKINLISPRTERNADQVHFADGVLACRRIMRASSADEIYDLGSGNGIPGLVYAVLNPKVRINVVDADSRKCEFIKHVASKSSLRNVHVSHLRLEDLDDGSIKCAMARGLASISKLMIMARQACAPGCDFFHLKSDSWATEVAEIPSQALAYWEPHHLGDYQLPGSGPHFSIVITRRK